MRSAPTAAINKLYRTVHTCMQIVSRLDKMNKLVQFCVGKQNRMKMKTRARREAILEVATQAFQELGFERTSMSEICSRVGGSKATLYNYFPSKEELFFETISRSAEAEFNAVHAAIGRATDDIAESLHHFGESLLTFLYSPVVRAQRSLVISEAGRTELGQLVYERTVKRSQNLVSEFLQEAMSQGKLRQADPNVVTKHLYSLLESELLDRLLYQIDGEIGADEIKAASARAIDVFMAAYGVRNN